MSQDDAVRNENDEAEVEGHKHSVKAATAKGATAKGVTDEAETESDDFEAHRHTKGRPTTR
jgi:hypothetical protein